MKPLSLGLLFSLSTAVLGHGGILKYVINGAEYQGNPIGLSEMIGSTTVNPPDPTTPSIARHWYFYPVLDVDSSNMTCNFDGLPSAPSLTAPVTAGSNITVFYNSTGTDTSPIPAYYWKHGHGPLLAYLARCPNDDCTNFTPTSTDKIWFKIAQIGVHPTATTLKDDWWQWDLIGGMSDGTPGWAFTIPENLRRGQYLLRNEVVMLASVPAQFYPNCAQIEVRGEGGKEPSEGELVAFPGAYRADDPGIVIADWAIQQNPTLPQFNTTNYTFPGPDVWTGK